MSHSTYPTTLRDALMKAYFAGWHARDAYPDEDLAGQRVQRVLDELAAEGVTGLAVDRGGETR